MRREPRYSTEAALCEAFITWTKKFGWIAYAETAGWDIVLVKSGGVQIGVQAKLHFNVKVLTQTLPNWIGHATTGPDYRAVLIGDHPRGADTICDQLGMVLFYPFSREFHPDDPEIGGGFSRYGSAWFDWNPERRIKLPDYVPDVVAGASAPVQLTPWKVGALHLTALLELRGFITRADFRDHHINPTRWTVFGAGDARAWVIPGATRGQWVRGPGLAFDLQHPTVFAAIRAETEKKLRTPKP